MPAAPPPAGGVAGQAEESGVWRSATVPDRLAVVRVTTTPGSARRRARNPYSYWFYLPAAVIYTVLFLLPTFASFYFSLTRWSLFDSKFIGLDNFARSSRNRRWSRASPTR